MKKLLLTFVTLLLITVVFSCKKTTDNTTCPHYTFYIPNSFTPNHDGITDTFSPKMAQAPTSYEMRVYSSSGEQLFHTHDYTKGWDGTLGSSGPIGAEGTYSYKINLTDSCGTSHTYSGNVYLVR